MAGIKKVDRLLAEADNLVMTELEKRVRSVLRRGGRAKRFTMAMGTWFFSDKEGEPIDIGYPPPRWAEPVDSLFDKYDEILKLTGQPMRIDSASGPRLTDW